MVYWFLSRWERTKEKRKTVMAIFVDDEQIQRGGKSWCHMVAESLPELHEFAKRLGLRRSSFQFNVTHAYYDITVGVREKALRLGASMGDRPTIITCAKQLKTQLITGFHLVPFVTSDSQVSTTTLTTPSGLQSADSRLAEIVPRSGLRPARLQPADTVPRAIGQKNHPGALSIESND
jgi:hypothetical protein